MVDPRDAVNKAVAVVLIAIVAIVGVMTMGQICPIAYANTANNPSAFHSATQICTAFFQNAPQLANHLT